MLAQVNINQQNMTLYIQDKVQSLMSSRIKGELGEEIFIRWQIEESDILTDRIDITEIEAEYKEKESISKYGVSAKEALAMQMSVGGKLQRNGKWVNATQTEVAQYCLPGEGHIEKYKYQFLNLAETAGISEEAAKVYLEDKGILKGYADAFINAAKTYHINEVYLMAHAVLETGNGTSKLATGVSYKGITVYNVFGIKAYDKNPVGNGAAYAYKMGWTSPEKAITGGAKYISESYINHVDYKQDTLYEMRWNPASPGVHQYASDIEWATKQAVWIQKAYESFENPRITFDIPKYSESY